MILLIEVIKDLAYVVATNFVALNNGNLLKTAAIYQYFSFRSKPSEDYMRNTFELAKKVT